MKTIGKDSDDFIYCLGLAKKDNNEENKEDNNNENKNTIFKTEISNKNDNKNINNNLDNNANINNEEDIIFKKYVNIFQNT